MNTTTGAFIRKDNDSFVRVTDSDYVDGFFFDSFSELLLCSMEYTSFSFLFLFYLSGLLKKG